MKKIYDQNGWLLTSLIVFCVLTALSLGALAMDYFNIIELDFKKKDIVTEINSYKEDMKDESSIPVPEPGVLLLLSSGIVLTTLLKRKLN